MVLSQVAMHAVVVKVTLHQPAYAVVASLQVATHAVVGKGTLH